MSTIRLFNQPVESLNTELTEKVDVVVAETYLGPPLSGRESPQQINKIISEMSQRISIGLTAVRELLKKDGVAVVALPAFQNNEGVQYLSTQNLVGNAGLKIVEILPTTLPKEMKTKTPSGGLLYARKDQKVGREIVKLVKA